jgi:hypothetical protein
VTWSFEILPHLVSLTRIAHQDHARQGPGVDLNLLSRSENLANRQPTAGGAILALPRVYAIIE